MTPPPPNKKVAVSGRVANTTHHSKKRKRSPKPQQYGLDLPEIPGIPVEIVPLHVQALKCSTTYFLKSAQAASHPIVQVDTSRCDEPAADPSLGLLAEPLNDTTGSVFQNGRNPLDSVWKQMAQTQNSQQQQRAMEHDLLQQRDQAVTSWLNAIHRWLKNHQHRSSPTTLTTSLLDPTSPGKNAEPAAEEAPVDKHDLPVVILQHLLEMILCRRSSTKLARRRAGTFLMGHLLLKSSAARHSFFGGTNSDTTTTNCKQTEGRNQWGMLNWIEVVASACQDHVDTASLPNSTNLSFLWQKEAHLLLQRAERDYGDLYPTVTTALLKFEQLCPEVVSLTINSFAHNDKSIFLGGSRTATSMVERRRARDVALNHWQTEVRTVTRLVQRARKCTDILVPRMTEEGTEDIGSVILGGVKRSAETAAPTIEATLDPTANGDDDSDVDWEDGLDTAQPHNHNNNSVAQEQPMSVDSFAHAQAVDHTLAAMVSAGGMTGGALTIDMSNAAKGDDAPFHDNHNHDVELQLSAQEELSKVARKLLLHQSRLAMWIEALTTADELHASAANTTALVRMSLEQRRERSAVLMHLRDCQQQVAIVLRQAQELRVFPTNSNVPVAAAQSPSGPTLTEGVVAASAASATTVLRSGNLDLSGGLGNPSSRIQNRHYIRAGQASQQSRNAASHQHRIQIKYKKKL